ncbi:hypothetical protein ['Chrysanthemum coronarium' phytoplasma]|uniref:Transmembrane protein n=1 Tax='Chrysanthemum coronarium' phytoplasma TaxID=1520703 RepID=A0ABQ0J3N9_9MOLU|nr:hypothetical protein ['Chrysanthemum coronarium' phytoplasma]GAK74206.1 hypothetical protein OYV_07060 ['Chrysanthemum coronarium' phytoplasma]
MMNKKRKLILIIWTIFIAIILLILLFLLGLRLPKLFKQPKSTSSTQQQYQYQTQYIYDTNKVKNIVRLLTELKKLKQLKNKQLQKQVLNQKETQPINNLDFFDPKVQNDLYHKLSKSMDEQMIQFSQKDFVSSEVPSEQLNDDNQLVKDISVVILATGAVVISCVVLTPIFASVGPIAAPLALLL